ncbi:MAG: two-component system, cell cycle sensor histidine kinase DivJ [Alphaproteobacteria bacterium]|nr:two-component system, cell cycle sensor histidine kinase DivJ [Alphaproteobacteria bacterium]
MNILAPVRDYIDALVHPTARQDALVAARHRAFIAPRLLGSFAALAAFPLYLTMRGIPSAIEIGIVAWLVAPILVAYFLSRTGHYEGAHMLSSLALTGLVAVVAFNSGGLASFAAVWLVIVPLEAALSASRRVVAAAAVFTIGATVFLFVLGVTKLLPGANLADGPMLAALGIISAVLYATGVALGGEALARTGFWLRYAEDDGYQWLVRHMTDVITRHGRNGAVLSISPAAEPLFGAKIRDLLGHGLFDRVHVADRPAYLTALASAAADGTVTTVEFRVRRGTPEDAREIQFLWIEMRCRPIAATNQRVDERSDVVAVLRDISERKAQEQVLAEARAEAERVSASKSRFVTTMSHELRTPLNVIIGFSELLAKQAPVALDAARREEYAQLINESGRHLLSIVNGILDMSKIEAGIFEITRETFAPAQVVANCCELMALKASQAGIALERQIEADIPEILADKRAVNQILLNLLSNAVKFTERGGRISVKAAREGAFVAFEVADTGVGIAAVDLPRVGEPFFQAGACYERRHEGTGLGLSIVKGLVKLHSGEIDIRSRAGKGTHVIVRLPVDGEPVHKSQPPRAVSPVLIEPIAADYRVKKIA